MRIIILISGTGGTLLLLVRILGIFMEFRGDDIVLVSGLVLLGLVCLPAVIVDKYRHNRKIERIIKSYEGREKEVQEPDKATYDVKGWGMNNSPFRKRKSGLTWGGGNIKAAEATRGTRRSFLRR